jgi:hypothetical protein
MRTPVAMLTIGITLGDSLIAVRTPTIVIAMPAITMTIASRASQFCDGRFLPTSGQSCLVTPDADMPGGPNAPDNPTNARQRRAQRLLRRSRRTATHLD